MTVIMVRASAPGRDRVLIRDSNDAHGPVLAIGGPAGDWS
jgi:hypothetical protein